MTQHVELAVERINTILSFASTNNPTFQYIYIYIYIVYEFAMKDARTEFDDSGTQAGGGQDDSRGILEIEPLPGSHKSPYLEGIKHFYSKLFLLLFLDAQGMDEPVVILSNSEYNIFSLVQSIVVNEYKLSAERFWHIARHMTDPPRETWRPRIQKNQTKSLSGTRYPMTEEEWTRLEEMLKECSDELRSDLDPEGIVMNLKDFVGNIRQVWTNQRRSRGTKRVAAGDLDGGGRPCAAGRIVADVPSHVIFSDGDPRGSENMNGSVSRARNSGKGMPSTSSSDGRAQQQKVTPATLLVGGREFTTTLATLSVVPNSFFAKLVMASDGAHDFFIDRSDEVFEDVLRYLRAKRYGESVENLPMRHDRHGLELLCREASFYNLSELTSIAKRRLKRNPPVLRVVSLETPVVESSSRLAEEIRIMNDRANTAVANILDDTTASDVTSLRVLSHTLVVHSDVANPEKKHASLTLTLERNYE